MSEAALRVRGLRKAYDGRRRRERPRSRGAGRRVLRAARARTAPARRRRSRSAKASRREIPATSRCSGCAGRPTPRALKQRLGIQLQETQLSEKLTVEETVRLFRSFFHKGPTPERVIALVQLEEKRRARVGTLSGGQKQRLALACALVGDPRALVPRRADDGARSAGAPPALGAHRRVQARGTDDPADDALHGRSRAALRASGHHGPRQDHRARVAARARRIDRRRARRGVLGRRLRRSRLDLAELRAIEGVRDVRADNGVVRMQVTALHRAVPALLGRARPPRHPAHGAAHAFGDVGGRLRHADGAPSAR